MTEPEIAVVGSGISGLSAAFRLQQAGRRVRFFEAGDRIGGKMRTTHRDGFVSDDGPSIVISSYSSILRLITDAGLGDTLVPGGTMNGFTRDGQILGIDSQRVLRDFLQTPLLSARAKLSLVKLGIDCLRIRKQLSAENLSLASDWDTESAADYARRELHPEVLEYMLEPAVRALFGDSTENVSRVILFYAISKLSIGSIFAFRGGMQAVAQQLAGAAERELSAQVLQVSEREDSVELCWRDATGAERCGEFSGCVIATAGPAAAAMRPQLDAWRRQFLSEMQYTAQLNVKLALSRPPAGLRAVYTQVSPAIHAGMAGILADHNKAPGFVPDGKGMLGFYTVSDWGRELMELDDAQIVDRVIAAAQPLLPEFRGDVEFTQVHRWELMAPRCDAGYYQKLAQFTQLQAAHDRRVQFAGDYFSCANLDTAAASGEVAARQLLRHLA